MSDKAWIKIHTGLTNDPRHRANIGNRIWLFMWLVGQVNWETGIVEFYTDAWAAEEMSCEDIKMSDRTIERQRQELAALGYIRCHAGDQCQHVRIMKWRNPKLLNPPMINDPADETTWYAIPRTPPRSNLRTPTILDSQSLTPAARIVERHFGITPQGINADQYEGIAEEFSLAELEEACIATVNAGGGHKMRPNYVRAICQRRKDERNGSSEDVSGLIAAIAKDAYGE